MSLLLLSFLSSPWTTNVPVMLAETLTHYKWSAVCSVIIASCMLKSCIPLKKNSTIQLTGDNTLNINNQADAKLFCTRYTQKQIQSDARDLSARFSFAVTLWYSNTDYRSKINIINNKDYYGRLREDFNLVLPYIMVRHLVWFGFRRSAKNQCNSSKQERYNVFIYCVHK